MSKKLDMDKIAKRLRGKRVGIVSNPNILDPFEASRDMYRRRQDQIAKEEKNQKDK